MPLGVAILALVMTVFFSWQLLQSLRLDDHVENSAHRGASLAAPENTLSAVTRAINDGATFVEVDVQRTADGVIVVAHDADLMRVARMPLVISESSYDELRRADVGAFFVPKSARQHIPTLDEVIDATKGKVKLIVELKTYSADSDLLVADVVRKLKAHNLLSDADIMSLKYDETQKVKQLAPEITTGFVAAAALGDISKLEVDFLAVSKARATDALIGAAHAQGKDVYVWTVDDRGEMFALIDRGVDNIITNDPATLAAVLEERLRLGNAERILLRFKSLYVW
jgi:glycerophosphoryl diester phosphodiesterase